ncbi:MAG: flagellar hook-associated protein FlgL [Gammaproteobacteria bacterium]|jgi:flagellar hook-associated protein 3 FlgL
MRVSTRSLQLQFLAAMGRQQAELAKIQQQATTGKKVSSAGDNPAAAVQIVALQQSLEQLESYETNARIARGRLNMEEQALSSVVDVVQRVRDLVIDARGPGKTRVELDVIRTEVEELLTNLVDIANSQDGEGRFLFSGNLFQTKPFDTGAAGVTYAGDQGTRSQRISDSRTLQEGDSGAEVFQLMRPGNGTFTVTPAAGNTGGAYYSISSVTDPGAWDGQNYTIQFTAADSYDILDSLGTVIGTGAYTPGQSIAFAGISIDVDGVPNAGDEFDVEPSRFQSLFDSVAAIVSMLDTDPAAGSADRATFQSLTNGALLDLDQALEHISLVRSRVGLRLSVLDEQEDTNEKLRLEVSQVLSRVQDTDFAAVISELEAQAFALEAAQRGYARIQSQSLFELI